jgi:ketosteroid isomerase-like protein
MQVLVDVKLATATMLTTSTVTASDGVSQTFRGRSTVVFLKMPDDSWVIGHEHIDLINPPVAPAPGGTRPKGEPTDEEVA